MRTNKGSAASASTGSPPIQPTSTEAGAAASAVESPSSLSDTATGFSHVVIDIDELEKSDDSGGDSSSEHDGGQFDAAEEAQEGDTEDEDAEQPDLLEIQRAIMQAQFEKHSRPSSQIQDQAKIPAYVVQQPQIRAPGKDITSVVNNTAREQRKLEQKQAQEQVSSECKSTRAAGVYKSRVVSSSATPQCVRSTGNTPVPCESTRNTPVRGSETARNTPVRGQ